MSDSIKHLEEHLKLAEIKAKERENLSKVNLDSVFKEAQKANELGVGLYIKEKKNKAEFVQVIKENLSILIRGKYLTNAEMAFIFSIQPFLEMHSNAIVHEDSGQFYTVSEIAKLLGRDLSGTSKIINELIRKGIIYEFANVDEIREFKRPVSRRPLFFNPEIVYCGDRNKINATLSRLAVNIDKLEKKKIHLGWKLWINHNDEYGALYRRSTYQKLKKGK